MQKKEGHTLQIHNPNLWFRFYLLISLNNNTYEIPTLIPTSYSILLVPDNSQFRLFYFICFISYIVIIWHKLAIIFIVNFIHRYISHIPRNNSFYAYQHCERRIFRLSLLNVKKNICSILYFNANEVTQMPFLYFGKYKTFENFIF